MKKIIALLLALTLVCALCLTGCGAKEKTLAELQESGVIVMGTNAQFPPYEYYADDGSYAGIDVEIMTAIATKLGVTLKVEDMDFDSIVPAVQSGKVDVGAAGMTVTEDRLKNINFTNTYTKAKQVIIVPEGSAIKSADDFAGKKIGAQTGTTGELYVTWDYEDTGLATVERYKSGMEAVQSLLQGKIDAVVIDNEPAKVFVSENPGLVILETEYVEEEYAIAVAKQNTEILDAINAALTELIADGTVQAIIDKYIPAGE